MALRPTLNAEELTDAPLTSACLLVTQISELHCSQIFFTMVILIDVVVAFYNIVRSSVTLLPSE